MDRQQQRFIIAISLLVSGMLGLSVVHAAPDGAELYRSNCSACHGHNGLGGVGVPLALPAFLHSVPDDYLAKTIRLGRPGRVMPAQPHLSDAQIDAIIKHVRSLAPGKAPVYTPVIIKGNRKKGKKLYGQYCASCHGANGEGGRGTGVTFSRPRDQAITAPALNNPGFLAAASDQLIKTSLMKGREGTPMPSFIKQGMSEEDINDVVSYVRSFERHEPVRQQLKTPDKLPVIVMQSPYDLLTTVENVKAAAIAANYRIIRVQEFDKGLVKPGKETKKEIIIYFCNFKLLNDMLAVDPRVGIFLPCRITVVEREGKVQVMSINPRYLSALYNNSELDKGCDQMYSVYNTIMEEATL